MENGNVIVIGAQTFKIPHESRILAHFDEGLPFGIGPPIGKRLDLLSGERERNEERFYFLVEFLALLLGQLRLLLIEPIAYGAEDGG